MNKLLTELETIASIIVALFWALMAILYCTVLSAPYVAVLLALVFVVARVA